jgi:hypothetical protein
MSTSIRFVTQDKVVAADVPMATPPRVGEKVIVRPNGGHGTVIAVEWDIWREGAICTVHFVLKD